MSLQQYRTILIIGIIEILIGGITLATTLASMVIGMNPKNPNVLFFVMIAACISTILGLGILKFNRLAYKLLLYFSSVILLTKLLIFLNILQLNGALETYIPSVAKNSISIAYHGFLVYFLRKQEIKNIFAHS